MRPSRRLGSPAARQGDRRADCRPSADEHVQHARRAAITAGRLLAVPLALRIAPPRLVAGALLLAAASLALAHSPSLAPFAFTLTGLALAPVFPTGLAWLAAAAPATRASTALVIAGAQLGGVVLPAVVGWLIDAGSPAVIPSALLAIALACLGTALLLRSSAANP
jgi:MFS transporter, FHS family, glucose/mannose:H+ symporter